MKEILMADAALGNTLHYPHPLSANWQTPRAVFLTGSTGFLGVYLLAELLHRTQADIYCLVRAADSTSGMQRIRERMQFYQVWQDNVAKRIRPIPGDLSLPKLGMSDPAFNELATSIDVIYHNGAQVNALYPYARLKAGNVSGTLEVLKLAGLHHTKPVNFVSTLAVFFSDTYIGRTVAESEFASLDEALKGGYKQSKWVAEGLVRAARERGLPTVIHRPGRILGDSRTGIIDRFSDLLGNMMQGCLQMEQFPSVETTLNVAPVDYVSRAIVLLGQQQSALNRNFHISNPQSIDWQTLWQTIRDLGYSAESCALPDWIDAINQRAKDQQNKQLYLTLKHLLRSKIYLFAPKPDFATTQTATLLQQSGLVCPPVDAGLVAAWLSYFEKTGSIPAPHHPCRV
jgi:thioester reductase-like protein